MNNNEIMATIQTATTVILADYYKNGRDIERLVYKLERLADINMFASKVARKGLVDAIKDNVKSNSKQGYNNYMEDYSKLVNNK